MEGTLTIGMLLGFQILLTLFSAPIRHLVDAGARLRDAYPGLERLDDVLGQPLDPTFNATEAPLARIGGTLRMDRVSFGYAPLDPPLIEDFSLTLPPGARIGVVGRSGSGKSTIGRLAVGLYQPWGGEISLDGRPFPSIPRAALRHSIAYVGQGSALFPGTIRDNLGLWDPTLPDDRLIQAAHDALIHPDIIARPLGLDHPVAENGRDFSGGQRQRMMIARALASDPLLIVLDEATNELDAETEARVLENIRRRGCGCIIIAHRLSTIRFCDEIIVMREGRIAERGTHDALLRLDGEYRSLACL
jgi:ABC-type bacteriocin/lantibiotic exporter with double-glycine peptidase domain